MTAPGFGVVPRGLAGKLTAYELAVYVTLTWHADFDDGTCFPSQATIAREAGCSVDSVRRAVKGLTEKGLLTVRRRTTESGGETSSMYRIEVYRRAPLPLTATPPDALSQDPPSPQPHEQEPSINTKDHRPPPPDGGGAVAVLPGMPDEPERRYTASDLVRTWVDGYEDRRGTAPLPSQVKRMASTAKRLAVDLDSLDDPRAWDAGLHLARRAGQDAHLDLITAIGRYHERSGTTAWWVELGRQERARGLES